MKVYEVIKSAAKKMQIEFEEITSQVNHRPTKGDFRENILKDFLKKYLPENFGICKGIVIDVDGNQSNQQDILIYDKSFTPRFLHTDDENVLPIESILATIEVKSTLTREELRKALDNIKSIRSLNKSFSSGQVITTYHPFGFIFSYDSINMENLIEVYRVFFRQSTSDSLPTLICSLQKGCILHMWKENIEYISINLVNSTFGLRKSEEKGDNLMLFYLILTKALFFENHNNRFPDLSQYAIKSGFVNPGTLVANEELQGVKVITDDYTLDAGKMSSAIMEASKYPEDSPERMLHMLLGFNDATGGYLDKFITRNLKPSSHNKDNTDV